MALGVVGGAGSIPKPGPTPLEVDDISGVEVRLSLGLRSLVAVWRSSIPEFLVIMESTPSLLLAFPILVLLEGDEVVDGDEDETDVGEADVAAVVELNT